MTERTVATAPASSPRINLADNPAVFEFSGHIRYSEVDHRALLTLPALIDYFQDCSTFQSEAVGVGMEWLKQEQKAWVLSHWQIAVDRYPRLCEEVAVGTFAYKFRGLMASRNFYMRDASGQIIARADSTWVFMDLAKGKPAKPSPEHTDPYGLGTPLDMPAESRKVSLPEHLEAREPFPVRRSMIDTNEHVNNCQYVQMVLELLPRETSPRITRVDYRRAAVLGDVICPFMAQEGGRTVVDLRDPEGGQFATVELQ